MGGVGGVGGSGSGGVGGVVGVGGVGVPTTFKETVLVAVCPESPSRPNVSMCSRPEKPWIWKPAWSSVAVTVNVSEYVVEPSQPAGGV